MSPNLCQLALHLAALQSCISERLKRFTLCCRGAIVDTDDLVEALKSGKLQGYGGAHLSSMLHSMRS